MARYALLAAAALAATVGCAHLGKEGLATEPPVSHRASIVGLFDEMVEDSSTDRYDPEAFNQCEEIIVQRGDSAIPDLQQLVGSPDPFKRSWAIALLGEVYAYSAEKNIAGALDDPSPEVRGVALH